MSATTKLITEGLADSRKRRESSKQQQQLETSDEYVCRRHHVVLWALSSCLVVTVGSLGLLLAPLIARNYYQTQAQSKTTFAGDTDAEESDRAPVVLYAPKLEQERRFTIPSRPGRPSGTARAEVVPPPKSTIFCVLEVGLAAGLAAASAPCRFCSHVVLCCAAVDPSWLDVDGMSLETAAASLRKHHPHVKRVLGIGDASMNETAFASAIDDSMSRTRLVANIVRTMKNLGFDGGSLICVMHPEHLEEFEKFVKFVKALCLLAAEVPLRTAVFLPSEHDAEAKLYEGVRSINVSHYLTLIKLTHATNLEQYPPRPLPCPTPGTFFDAQKTEKELKRFEQRHGNATGPPMFLVTLSAAVLEFNASAEDNARVNFQRVVGRDGFCVDRSWSLRRSDGCVVASAVATVRVGHDPQSDRGAWRRAHGVVVFDMNLDDTRGKCGPPYSFTRSVYFALETHAGK